MKLSRIIAIIAIFSSISLQIFQINKVNAEESVNANITGSEINASEKNNINSNTTSEQNDSAKTEERVTQKAESNNKIPEPNINAGSAILIENSTEKELYSKNANQKMYPASTTKILTAILTIENCNLNDIVTVPYEALATIPSGYSVAALQAGEELTVEQLLELLLVHSANDAANVLAFHISSDLDAFATLMNSKIQELGLTNTHFTNPSGQHNENHYTTAHDLAIIMKYCMKNSEFRKLAGLKYCSIPATNKYEERVFNTTNEMLIYDTRNVSSNYYYKYEIAGKTGYTTQAKNCLVSVANKDGFELISVVLSCGLYENGLSGRYLDTKTLFEYGYNNYSFQKIREKDAIAKNIEVPNATKETKNLDLTIENDIYAVVPNSQINSVLDPQIEIQENIEAPIAQGKILGKISYNIDNVEYSSNLLASHNVEQKEKINLLTQIILLIIILFFLYKLLKPNKKKKMKSKRKNK